ncbi:MAG: DUF2974 domain-containing protein [Clostridiales bacterium]|nr:DUF2974 domain-containing protein [Clostridiales bacterium]
MTRRRKDIFHYIDSRGGMSFQQSAFNEVDALILSVLAYLDFSFVKDGATVSLPDAAEAIRQMPDAVKYNGLTVGYMRSVVRLAEAAARSARFREMKVFRYVNLIDEETEMQFSAVSFLLPDRTLFLSFRGTDNTLVGWKEDLNMGFMHGVPAQWEAVNYVVRSLSRVNLPFRLGGHSKGGNLAVWAGAHLPADCKRNLIAIYNNDGPGFDSYFLESAQYRAVRAKIASFVPASSIVGVLMEHDDYTTIRSSSLSFLQHDPFSWLVDGTRFFYADTRTASGLRFETALNAWIRSLSAGERKTFVEYIYLIICASEAKTLQDLMRNKRRSLRSMRRSFVDMEREKRSQLLDEIRRFTLRPETEW